MNKEEIIQVLKSHKKYSSNFRFEEDYIYFNIGGVEYKIDIWDNWKKFTFNFSYSKYSVKGIQAAFEKDKATNKRILSKFREVVKAISTLDVFLKKREEYLKKIEPAILSYIKEQFYLEEIQFDNMNNTLRMNFPKTSFIRRDRYKSSNFDPSKEKIGNKLVFDIFVTLKNVGYYYIDLNFVFRTDTNKLTLTSKNESYRALSKDITKIIRGEKLKKLMFSNEESN
jgi:phage-related protein